MKREGTAQTTEKSETPIPQSMRRYWVHLTIALLAPLILAALILVLARVPASSATSIDSIPPGTQGPEGVGEYWLLLELTPHSVAIEDQVSQMVALLVPYLADQQQQGQLDGFTLDPELGAIRLESPGPRLLAQLPTWPGVRSVVPANEWASKAIARQVETAHLTTMRAAPTAPSEVHSASDARLDMAGVGGLESCTIYENENRVDGQVITPSLSITLTLKTGGAAVKSQIATVADDLGDFRAYFTATIQGGDMVEVVLPGEPPVAIDVPTLTLEANKATDTIYGTAPASATVDLDVYSYASDQWYWLNTTVGADGRYAADYSSIVDIFLGDEMELWYTNSDGFEICLRDRFVPGLSVSLLADYAWGYAEAGVTVTLVIKDNSGVVKAVAIDDATESGYFWADFEPEDDPCAQDVDIVVGDRVEMKYGSQPTVTVQVVDVTVTSIDPSTDVVAGTAPASSKVEVYAYDSYVSDNATVVVTASLAGGYTAGFGSTLDLALGSYTSVAYHDAQDNEVSGGSLYASPYVRVDVNAWDDLQVMTQPGGTVKATLRNALGAIKGTAGGTAANDGSLYLDFYDSASNDVDAIPGDQVEVGFGGGVTSTVDVAGIDFVVSGRDDAQVSGTGPSDTSLRVVHPWESGTVTTTHSGAFSFDLGWVWGGSSVEVIYRNTEGSDLSTHGYVPQFTVYPASGYLYGYGPSREAVVVTLKDSGGVTKGTANDTTQDNGYYWIDFGDVDIAFGDTVVVDMGPLHYEQEVVTLTVAADTVNNTVYGTAPPDGWLNVWADRWFGPYEAFYYKGFYADYAGQFATGFYEGADVRGGDWLAVQYWEGGNKDRVYVYRYAPNVGIYHQADRVSGYTTPGAVGTVTIRESGGALKASGAVTGSQPYGYFVFAPKGVDIVPGDQVDVQVGAIDQSVNVVPMSGTLDLDMDTARGTSLPDAEVGIAVYHWRDTYYDDWTDNGSLSLFAETNGSGAFSVDFHCVTDLETGDYLGLYFMDNLDTYYNAYSYTTQPTVTVDSYPTAVQPGAPVEVQFTIAGGAHPTGAYVRWDTASHSDDDTYSNHRYIQGAIGSNVTSFNAPTAGTIYFRVQAYVDGQTVWSVREYTITVEGNVATVLIDPVSGTTKDDTPAIQGVAPPNASVTLYEGAAALMTTTAGTDGHFTFSITTPLSASAHDLHAAATVNETTGPDSNVVHLVVSPTLKVDPVHITLASRGVAQHLRDESGYANLGGRIWTRTGDAVEVTIPISCTDVYTADLYVGGVLAVPLLNSGDDIYVGAYTPPGSGTYAVDVKFRCGGPSGVDHTVNLLTGLIDPDGYVYDEEKGSDHRLAGATVTCYELVDEGSDTWQVWNAGIWEQVNPQTTAADGYHTFFTLPGKYKVKVTMPGYGDYESPVLTVVDAPVHYNVGLRLTRNVYLPLVMQSQ